MTNFSLLFPVIKFTCCCCLAVVSFKICNRVDKGNQREVGKHIRILPTHNWA